MLRAVRNRNSRVMNFLMDCLVGEVRANLKRYRRYVFAKLQIKTDDTNQKRKKQSKALPFQIKAITLCHAERYTLA